MVHVPFAAKRTGVVKDHLCIQSFVAGFVGDDAPIILYFEIRTFKHFVFNRTNKYEFHFLCQNLFDNKIQASIVSIYF